jgi:hypothetical protein
MGSPSNYTDLYNAIIGLGQDESSEYAAYVPTAIGLAQDRLFKLVDYDFSKEGTINTTSATATVAKPADYHVGHNMYLVSGGMRTRLIKKTEDFLKDYWPSTTATDVPKYYADQDNTNFRFAPTPNAAYPILVEYEFRPSYLTSSNQTNVWTSRYPDLLFYAAMSAICELQRDSERKAEYEARIQEYMATVQKDTDRATRDDATDVNNPDGGRNRKSV